MKLVRGAWRLLVGIKDGLVLLFMLLFFGLLFAALTARPGGRAFGEGALVLDLNGPIVEQPAEVSPLAALSGQQAGREYRLRDVVRVLDAARTDDRVKVVVLDLDRFGGGYPATLAEVQDAILRVRGSGKRVLAYATGYTDGGYRLASAASEVWVDPMGGTIFAGPGGTQPYLKGLIDRLGVTAHVYRVGTYKSAVEPYIRTDQSPESKEALGAVYGDILEEWRQAVRRARPRAGIDQFLAQPAQVIVAANGNIAEANRRAGLVDRLGDRIAFTKRVAQLAGEDTSKTAIGFKRIGYDQFLTANPLKSSGDAIGVVTVAGTIVDGRAGPGSAAGDTIAKAVLDGLKKHDLKALVVRVDSPGGSALASERIRQAILEGKRRGLPVVVSMGGLAASGGYWVATAGDTIFAEPSTITGSIGIFAVLPTFERSLAKIGVNADGVRTTPLSGQPDILAGTNPVVDTVLQAGIENGYRQFIARVAQARKMTPQRVDQIGQGRVWSGADARQLGLVDRFGGLEEAVAEAARRARLDAGSVRTVYLEKEPGFAAQLARSFGGEEEGGAPTGDAFGRIAAERRALVARALADAKGLLTAGSVQARCLECASFGPAAAGADDLRVLDLVMAKLGW